jgi:hypothetical protein
MITEELLFRLGSGEDAIKEDADAGRDLSMEYRCLLIRAFAFNDLPVIG